MCPHFDNNIKKCRLWKEVPWSNHIMLMGYDYLTETFCFAPAYVPDSGQGGETGFKN